ncbi:hypothetical protein BJX63DRAFT_403206 [Aspergillus granulosus]|uniref:Uncharacterized protein n=1 Tax=Aspergillus granulosus TaxID=176169 RepID=A0ABR4H3U6_9EURO
MIKAVATLPDAFAAPTNASVPIGINGLKIQNGYVYFTNTARGLFGRLPISEDGNRAGEVEVISLVNVARTGDNWDDFVLDKARSGVCHSRALSL